MFDRFHKTKILCTVGPAVLSVEKITELVKAGADAFRLNMSHGDHETHGRSIQIIREVEKNLNVFLPIVADIQGPKLRVGDLPDGAFSLVNGQEVQFCHETVWKKRGQPDNLIPLRYPTVARDVGKDNTIMFDDGLLKVKVLESDGEIVTALVVNGGLLKSRKGINMPNVHVSQPTLTAKDKKDLVFAIENDCDYAAISFVRTASDVANARAFVKKHKGKLHLIAKIEKPEAIVNIDRIVSESDAVMIARGDLGVEIPAEQVPAAQKRIIRLCNQLVTPVITATQMLDSMITNPRPTRAEASDVANAVLDGTDGVMLSGETSVGAFPVEAVQYMRQICKEAEKEPKVYNTVDDEAVHGTSEEEKRSFAIAKSVERIATDLKIDAIATLTYTGRTVKYVSNRKPTIPIISVIPDDVHACRRVSLYWGVLAAKLPFVEDTDEAIECIKAELVQSGILPKGASLAITIGRPLKIKSRTNMISLENL